MSIAVSVIVRPSRVHRSLLGAFALVQGVLALALGFGTSSAYLGGHALALLPALAATVLIGAVARPPKTHQIDISGTGDLRVTVQQDVGAEVPAPVVVLPGSVVWPLLMVLRYGESGGAVRTLAIWRDAVDAGGWRALAVALTALGGRMRQSQ